MFKRVKRSIFKYPCWFSAFVGTESKCSRHKYWSKAIILDWKLRIGKGLGHTNLTMASWLKKKSAFPYIIYTSKCYFCSSYGKPKMFVCHAHAIASLALIISLVRLSDACDARKPWENYSSHQWVALGYLLFLSSGATGVWWMAVVCTGRGVVIEHKSHTSSMGEFCLVNIYSLNFSRIPNQWSS